MFLKELIMTNNICCKNCKNRKLYCHSTCEQYAEYKENVDKERIAERTYYQSRYTTHQFDNKRLQLICKSKSKYIK